MGALGEFPKLEGDWQALLADLGGPAAAGLGAFGHPQQRRLGLRVESGAWALLSRAAPRRYAAAVELSATGVVLEFVGRRFRLVVPPGLRVHLDLFVPGASAPVRAVVRSVRPLGNRQAFEFVEIAPADRLTLAEHLDRLMNAPEARTAPSASAHRHA